MLRRRTPPISLPAPDCQQRVWIYASRVPRGQCGVEHFLGVAGETHVASLAGKGDAATGESPTVLTGVGMDSIERWAAMADGGPSEQRLILVRDGRVESARACTQPSVVEREMKVMSPRQSAARTHLKTAGPSLVRSHPIRCATISRTKRPTCFGYVSGLTATLTATAVVCGGQRWATVDDDTGFHARGGRQRTSVDPLPLVS
jgi:hypothetical protein